MRGFFAAVITALLAFAAPAYGESVLESKRKGVKVFEKASKKAKVITKLEKGQTLNADDRAGMYWKVKLKDGRKGFVSIMAVKRKKVGSGNKLSNALRNAVQKNRESSDSSNVRSRSAVMGVRGLDESKDLEFVGNVKPNLRMVFSMEEREIDQKSLEKLERDVFNEIESRMK